MIKSLKESFQNSNTKVYDRRSSSICISKISWREKSKNTVAIVDCEEEGQVDSEHGKAQPRHYFLSSTKSKLSSIIMKSKKYKKEQVMDYSHEGNAPSSTQHTKKEVLLSNGMTRELYKSYRNLRIYSITLFTSSSFFELLCILNYIKLFTTSYTWKDLALNSFGTTSFLLNMIISVYLLKEDDGRFVKYVIDSNNKSKKVGAQIGILLINILACIYFAIQSYKMYYVTIGYVILCLVLFGYWVALTIIGYSTVCKFKEFVWSDIVEKGHSIKNNKVLRSDKKRSTAIARKDVDLLSDDDEEKQLLKDAQVDTAYAMAESEELISKRREQHIQKRQSFSQLENQASALNLYSLIKVAEAKKAAANYDDDDDSNADLLEDLLQAAVIFNDNKTTTNNNDTNNETQKDGMHKSEIDLLEAATKFNRRQSIRPNNKNASFRLKRTKSTVSTTSLEYVNLITAATAFNNKSDDRSSMTYDKEYMKSRDDLVNAAMKFNCHYGSSLEKNDTSRVDEGQGDDFEMSIASSVTHKDEYEGDVLEQPTLQDGILLHQDEQYQAYHDILRDNNDGSVNSGSSKGSNSNLNDSHPPIEDTANNNEYSEYDTDNFRNHAGKLSVIPSISESTMDNENDETIDDADNDNAYNNRRISMVSSLSGGSFHNERHDNNEDGLFHDEHTKKGNRRISTVSSLSGGSIASFPSASHVAVDTALQSSNDDTPQDNEKQREYYDDENPDYYDENLDYYDYEAPTTAVSNYYQEEATDVAYDKIENEVDNIASTDMYYDYEDYNAPIYTNETNPTNQEEYITSDIQQSNVLQDIPESRRFSIDDVTIDFQNIVRVPDESHQEEDRRKQLKNYSQVSYHELD